MSQKDNFDKIPFNMKVLTLRKLLLLSIILALLTSTASAENLTVGSKASFHTIQSAIDAAKDGDTITVTPGVYEETIKITDKQLSIIGQDHPSIYGARIWGGVTGTLYGLTFTKSGVEFSDGGHIIIQNCEFTNCGIDIWSQTCVENKILNNKLTNGGILLYETYDNTIEGNYIYGAKIGLQMGGGATCKSITKNTFQKCQVAAQLEKVPASMTGNIYKNNKVNIKIVQSA